MLRRGRKKRSKNRQRNRPRRLGPGRDSDRENFKSEGRFVQTMRSATCPFAQVLKTWMKYTDTYTITTVALSGAMQQYRMNSIFDPDFTGVGIQPYLFDQITPMYNRYRVLKFNWQISAPSITSTMEYLVVPCANGLGAAITTNATFNAAASLPFAKLRVCSASGPPVFFKGSCDLAKIAGSTYEEYDADDRFTALTSASPSEFIPLTFGTYNPNAANTVVLVTFQLWYFVELMDPIVLGASASRSKDGKNDRKSADKKQSMMMRGHSCDTNL